MCTAPEARAAAPHRRAQRGATLVELVVALTLLAVLMGSVWSAWALLGRSSADPLLARQALAVAQSLLREVELQPLPGAATTAPTAGRTGFASITDYDGLAMTGISDAEGTAVPGLEAYGASVSVTPAALADAASTHGWWVQVTVTGPDGRALTLAQWRARR